MYELVLLAQLNGFPGCKLQYNPIVVCNKRILYSGRLKKFVRHIKLSDKTEEFSVNRCTYLANEVDEPFTFEEDKKWCNKEKQLLTSVWSY
jgi:hypothetical protein